MSSPALPDPEPLRAGFAGQVLGPQDEHFDASAPIFNGMFDAVRPGVIARCASADDVVKAVEFGREAKLEIAVRAGGHSASGFSTSDGGLVIDLSPLKSIAVDPEARTAKVAAGVTWGELDMATQEHGLAVTGGRVTTTGVAGLTLGSGSGWIERSYGVTCQSLRGAEVVTAAGEVIRAGEGEHADLLWGLRGGGGNFGVVTELEFDLHPVGPIVHGGMVMHPRAAAGDLIRFYRSFMATAPDGVSGGIALIHAPPAPFVPPEAVGQPMAGLLVMYVGPPDEGAEALKPLVEWGEPLVTQVGPMPYTAFQAILDDGAPRGIREYFKIDFLDDFGDEAVDAMLEAASTCPSPLTQIVIEPLGGAMERMDPDATALNTPKVGWAYHCLSLWPTPAEDEANIAWTREFCAAMDPHALGVVYPNFVSADEGEERMRASFGEEKWNRLVALKDRYDPDNLFRRNQNVAPSGWKWESY